MLSPCGGGDCQQKNQDATPNIRFFVSVGRKRKEQRKKNRGGFPFRVRIGKGGGGLRRFEKVTQPSIPPRMNPEENSQGLFKEIREIFPWFPGKKASGILQGVEY